MKDEGGVACEGKPVHYIIPEVSAPCHDIIKYPLRFIGCPTLPLACMVRASLSEPHNSGTAFCTCVCMLVCLLAAIYHKF